MPDKKKKFLSVDQLSSLCQVSRETVLGWMKQKLIVHYNSQIELSSLVNLNHRHRPYKPQSDTVLILDDEIDQIESMEMIFFSKKMKSHGTTDVIEALQFLNQYNPPLMTLDLHMDPIGGIEILKLITCLGLKQSTWIIVISGADQGELNQAMESGADFYLQKPVMKADLDRLITKLNSEKVAA